MSVLGQRFIYVSRSRLWVLLCERKKEGEWGLSERSRETDTVLRIRECMYQLLYTNVVHKKMFTTRFSSRRFSSARLLQVFGVKIYYDTVIVGLGRKGEPRGFFPTLRI